MDRRISAGKSEPYIKIDWPASLPATINMQWISIFTVESAKTQMCESFISLLLSGKYQEKFAEDMLGISVLEKPEYKNIVIPLPGKGIKSPRNAATGDTLAKLTASESIFVYTYD